MTLTSTILIVDDELGGRKTLELMLRPFGYDLAFATTGAEVLTQTSDELLMIAQLGGFLCRKRDTEPGMTTIWRGWSLLADIANIYLILHHLVHLLF